MRKDQRTTSYNTLVSFALRDLREKDLKMSQEKVAEMFDMKKAGWSKVERGDTRIPVVTVVALCAVAEKKLDSFYADIDRHIKALQLLKWEVTLVSGDVDDLKEGLDTALAFPKARQGLFKFEDDADNSTLNRALGGVCLMDTVMSEAAEKRRKAKVKKIRDELGEGGL